MAEHSAIEWTDATWNPVRGCTKVSPGCKNCYALTFAERFRGVPGHPFEQGFDLRLVPDKLEGAPSTATRVGVLGTTVVAFFLAEMGDKTQIATVALAAKYTAFAAVVGGTTLGMMIANVPVVLLGERIAHRIPLRLTRAVAAAMFAAVGAAMVFVEH